MREVWYAEEKKRGGVTKFYFQKVPFFFLKHVEQLKSVYDQNMVFGGFVSVGQLRIWARFFLWIKRVSAIKVW